MEGEVQKNVEALAKQDGEKDRDSSTMDTTPMVNESAVQPSENTEGEVASEDGGPLVDECQKAMKEFGLVRRPELLLKAMSCLFIEGRDKEEQVTETIKEEDVKGQTGDVEASDETGMVPANVESPQSGVILTSEDGQALLLQPSPSTGRVINLQLLGNSIISSSTETSKSPVEEIPSTFPLPTVHSDTTETLTSGPVMSSLNTSMVSTMSITSSSASAINLCRSEAPTGGARVRLPTDTGRRLRLPAVSSVLGQWQTSSLRVRYPAPAIHTYPLSASSSSSEGAEQPTLASPQELSSPPRPQRMVSLLSTYPKHDVIQKLAAKAGVKSATEVIFASPDKSASLQSGSVSPTVSCLLSASSMPVSHDAITSSVTLTAVSSHESTSMPPADKGMTTVPAVPSQESTSMPALPPSDKSMTTAPVVPSYESSSMPALPPADKSMTTAPVVPSYESTSMTALPPADKSMTTVPAVSSQESTSMPALPPADKSMTTAPVVPSHIISIQPTSPRSIIRPGFAPNISLVTRVKGTSTAESQSASSSDGSEQMASKLAMMIASQIPHRSATGKQPVKRLQTMAGVDGGTARLRTLSQSSPSWCTLPSAPVTRIRITSQSSDQETSPRAVSLVQGPGTQKPSDAIRQIAFKSGTADSLRVRTVSQSSHMTIDSRGFEGPDRSTPLTVSSQATSVGATSQGSDRSTPLTVSSQATSVGATSQGSNIPTPLTVNSQTTSVGATSQGSDRFTPLTVSSQATIVGATSQESDRSTPLTVSSQATSVGATSQGSDRSTPLTVSSQATSVGVTSQGSNRPTPLTVSSHSPLKPSYQTKKSAIPEPDSHQYKIKDTLQRSLLSCSSSVTTKEISDIISEAGKKPQVEGTSTTTTAKVASYESVTRSSDTIGAGHTVMQPTSPSSSATVVETDTVQRPTSPRIRARRKPLAVSTATSIMLKRGDPKVSPSQQQTVKTVNVTLGKPPIMQTQTVSHQLKQDVTYGGIRFSLPVPMSQLKPGDTFTLPMSQLTTGGKISIPVLGDTITIPSSAFTQSHVTLPSAAVRPVTATAASSVQSSASPQGQSRTTNITSEIVASPTLAVSIPSTVTVPQTIPASTVTIPQTIPASTVTLSQTVPASTVTVSQTVPASTVTVSQTVPASTITVSQTVPASTVTVSQTVPASTQLPVSQIQMGGLNVHSVAIDSRPVSQIHASSSVVEPVLPFQLSAANVGSQDTRAILQTEGAQSCSVSQSGSSDHKTSTEKNATSCIKDASHSTITTVNIVRAHQHRSAGPGQTKPMMVDTSVLQSPRSKLRAALHQKMTHTKSKPPLMQQSRIVGKAKIGTLQTQPRMTAVLSPVQTSGGHTAPIPQSILKVTGAVTQLIPRPAVPTPQPMPRPAVLTPRPMPRPAAPAPQPMPRPATPAPQPMPRIAAPSFQPIPRPAAPTPQPMPRPATPAPQPMPRIAAPSFQPIPRPAAPAPQPMPRPAAPAPKPMTRPAEPSPATTNVQSSTAMRTPVYGAAIPVTTSQEFTPSSAVGASTQAGLSSDDIARAATDHLNKMLLAGGSQTLPAGLQQQIGQMIHSSVAKHGPGSRIRIKLPPGMTIPTGKKPVRVSIITPDQARMMGLAMPGAGTFRAPTSMPGIQMLAPSVVQAQMQPSLLPQPQPVQDCQSTQTYQLQTKQPPQPQPTQPSQPQPTLQTQPQRTQQTQLQLTQSSQPQPTQRTQLQPTQQTQPQPTQQTQPQIIQHPQSQPAQTAQPQPTQQTQLQPVQPQPVPPPQPRPSSDQSQTLVAMSGTDDSDDVPQVDGPMDRKRKRRKSKSSEGHTSKDDEDTDEDQPSLLQDLMRSLNLPTEGSEPTPEIHEQTGSDSETNDMEILPSAGITSDTFPPGIRPKPKVPEKSSGKKQTPVTHTG